MLRANLIPKNPITRFAPSVTGWLHIGHVAHAVWVWGVARTYGAKIILRLDDHDRSRYRPEYDEAILRDLEWLGLEPDDAHLSPYRQRENDPYAVALKRLDSGYPVYACDCTRASIAKMSGPGEQARYGGRCRNRELARGPGRGLRIVVEPGIERFTDIRLGERHQDAADMGDPLLLDRNGNWTYHFSVVVDDLKQGVNLVIRGEDLLFSTGRQLRLARMLERESSPAFLHHPLVMADNAKKLSKRDGALGLRELRADGASAEDVLGLAAQLAGLADSPAPLPAAELGGLFER